MNEWNSIAGSLLNEVLSMYPLSNQRMLEFFFTDISLASAFTVGQLVDILAVYTIARDRNGSQMFGTLQNYFSGMGFDSSGSREMAWHVHLTFISAEMGMNVTEFLNFGMAMSYMQIAGNMNHIFGFLNDVKGMLPAGAVGNTTSTSNTIQYPGNDPTRSPGRGFEWRGSGNPSSGKGNWYNPRTGESLHPDLNHPAPIGPHWDYRAPNGIWYRIHPDGRFIPK